MCIRFIISSSAMFMSQGYPIFEMATVRYFLGNNEIWADLSTILVFNVSYDIHYQGSEVPW